MLYLYYNYTYQRGRINVEILVCVHNPIRTFSNKFHLMRSHFPSTISPSATDRTDNIVTVETIYRFHFQTNQNQLGFLYQYKTEIFFHYQFLNCRQNRHTKDEYHKIATLDEQLNVCSSTSFTEQIQKCFRADVCVTTAHAHFPLRKWIPRYCVQIE